MDRRRFLEISGATAASILAGCGGGSGSTTTPPPAPPNWTGLAAGMDGTLIRPTDAAYAIAAPVLNPRYDAIKPQAIARCASVDDVKEVLAFVRTNNLAVTPRCGGHSYSGSSTTTGVVIDVTPMNSIQVNNDGTARIGAGAKIVDVYDQLIAKGVGLSSGTCTSVGISGITMGGGIGILDRTYGLTCDALISAEVVTADGQLRLCDATHEPELFWALRGGGGGNFGVTTSFTFRTHPIQDITNFSATYSLDDAAKVFTAWQARLDNLPDKIWTQLFIDFESYLPAPTIRMAGFCLGAVAEIEPYWSEMLASAQAVPLSQSVTLKTYRETMLSFCGSLTPAQCHRVGETPEGVIPLDRSAFVASSDFFNSPLPAAGIDALLQSIRDVKRDGGNGYVILDQMKGAISRVGVTDTAFPHRNALFSAEYWLFSTLAAPTWQNDLRTTMRQWNSGGAYVNYLDPLIQDWKTAYYGANYARLAQVKTMYDPNRVFNMLQGVTPG